MRRSRSEDREPDHSFQSKQDQIVQILQAVDERSTTIMDMGIEEQSLEKVIQRLYDEERKLL